MLTTDAAAKLAELVRLGSPTAECLRRLAETAVLALPSCCGATATLWARREPELTAATHPDLGWLIEYQGRSGEGPALTAIDEAAPVVVDDMLAGSRWARYRAEAARRGIRSQLTLAARVGGQPFTLAAYGVRTQRLGPASLGTLAMLAGHGSAALENAARFAALQDTGGSCGCAPSLGQ